MGRLRKTANWGAACALVAGLGAAYVALPVAASRTRSKVEALWKAALDNTEELAATRHPDPDTAARRLLALVPPGVLRDDELRFRAAIAGPMDDVALPSSTRPFPDTSALDPFRDAVLAAGPFAWGTLEGEPGTGATVSRLQGFFEGRVLNHVAARRWTEAASDFVALLRLRGGRALGWGDLSRYLALLRRLEPPFPDPGKELLRLDSTRVAFEIVYIPWLVQSQEQDTEARHLRYDGLFLSTLATPLTASARLGLYGSFWNFIDVANSSRRAGPCSVDAAALIRATPRWRRPSLDEVTSELTLLRSIALSLELTRLVVDAKEARHVGGTWPPKPAGVDSQACPGTRWIYEPRADGSLMVSWSGDGQIAHVSRR